MSRVIAHLEANLGNDHTLEDMADIAMISPFHFNRVFREVAGLSPVRYLYALRIAEAKRLILTTRLKIIDICYSVGYNSLGSFNKRFVSLVGHSPRRVRSIAATVDLAELRRLVAARPVPKKCDPREACSIYGSIHVPDGFSGVSMAALFGGPPSNEFPIANVLSGPRGYALPPIRSPGDYHVMAIGITWHERMADFLLQPNCLQAMMPSVYLSTGERSRSIDLYLRFKDAVDPLIPPSLPFRLVEQFVQLPGEPAEDDVSVPRAFKGWRAASASLRAAE